MAVSCVLWPLESRESISRSTDRYLCIPVSLCLSLSTCFSLSLSCVPVFTQKVASAPSLHNLVHCGNPAPSDTNASQLWPVPAFSELAPMVGTEVASTLHPGQSQCGFFCRTVPGPMASPWHMCFNLGESRLWAWEACEGPSELLGPGCGGCRWEWQLSPEASEEWLLFLDS